jgi:hypothetical protein
LSIKDFPDFEGSGRTRCKRERYIAIAQKTQYFAVRWQAKRDTAFDLVRTIQRIVSVSLAGVLQIQWKKLRLFVVLSPEENAR